MTGEKICRACGTRYPPDARFCLKDASELVSTSAAAPQQSGLVGVVLGGKYRVMRRIGGGGMGEVFEAVHERLGKRVAVKVLHRQFVENAEAMERFEREARLAASIGHPNIIDIIDFDATADGSRFMVMEFLEGHELRKILKQESRVAQPRALRIIAQVAQALGAAHERGVVHRDLKPENVILLERHGSADFVKVLDFGVSKMRSEGGNLTRTGMIVGTPYYMSPEQARGDASVDAQSDIYSIGAVLYEMIAGVVPFHAPELHTVLLRIITEEPAPLRSHVPDVSPAIEQIVARAMARERSQRYATCAMMVDDIAGVLESAGEGLTTGRQRMFTPPPISAPAASHSVVPAQATIGTGAPLSAQAATPPPASQRTDPGLRRSASGAPAAAAQTPGPTATLGPGFSRTMGVASAGTPAPDTQRLGARSGVSQGVARKARPPVSPMMKIVGAVAVGLAIVGGSVLWIRSSLQQAVDNVRSDRVTVTFEAIPTLTTVLREGKRLCDTPCQQEFMRGSTQFVVLFQHEGYVPEKRTVSLDQNSEVFVTLQPLATEPRPERAPSDEDKSRNRRRGIR